MTREEHNLKAKQYYQEHKEECKRKARERSRKWREEAPKEVRDYNRIAMRAWRLKCKVIVFSHYGKDGKPICVRCEESRLPCLSLDHIEGKGRKLRRAGERVGGALYSYLIRENFPSGFQTLCMNCQWIKRFENGENC